MLKNLNFNIIIGIILLSLIFTRLVFLVGTKISCIVTWEHVFLISVNAACLFLIGIAAGIVHEIKNLRRVDGNI